MTAYLSGVLKSRSSFVRRWRDVEPPAGEILPYVFLLYGDGGIGKTTLAKRFRDIALEDSDYKDKFQLLWLDWEDERKKFPDLQVGREQIQAEDVFEVIRAAAVRKKWGANSFPIPRQSSKRLRQNTRLPKS